MERHARALGRERAGEGRSGPAAGPGDEDDPIAQAEVQAQASGALRAEVGEELGPGAVAGPEQPEHGRRRHDRARLADAAHHRAQVGRLDDDADALRIESLLEELGDLLGQPLLDLQPAARTSRRCAGSSTAR